MKKAKTRQFDATSASEVDTAVASIEAAFSNLEGISKEDKAGGKISDKELAALRTAIENLVKIDNYLPRNFDADLIAATLDDFEKDKKKLANLIAAVKHVESEQTLRRVILKDASKHCAHAAEKTAKTNAAYKFISDKFKAAFARSSSNTEVVEDAAKAKK